MILKSKEIFKAYFLSEKNWAHAHSNSVKYYYKVKNIFKKRMFGKEIWKKKLKYFVGSYLNFVPIPLLCLKFE